MSVSTPILITPSVTCACAVPSDKAAATATPIMVRLNVLIVLLRWWFVLVSELFKPCLHAQVLMQLGHVGFEVRIADHVHDASMLHHVMPVGDGGRKPEILFDQQDRESPLLQLSNRAPDLLHDHRRQPFRRLIQQQETRTGAQDTSN